MADASRSLAVTERFGLDQGLLVAGSDDLLLGSLFELMRQQYQEYLVYVTNLGSFGGLEALRLRKAHVALCHLRDPDSGEYNIPFLKRSFAADAIVAVTLWHRRVGFLHHPNSPSVETFADLRRRTLRFVNRQRGSGVRWVIDHGLQEAKSLTCATQGIRGGSVDALGSRTRRVTPPSGCWRCYRIGRAALWLSFS